MVEIKKQNLKENKKVFNEVSNKIKNIVGDNVFIEHVGSTAIPYMYGKNIIDILIGANDVKEMDKLSKVITSLGFYKGKNFNNIYRFFANTKEETKSGDIHIHLVIKDSDRFSDFLVLKNYLLNNVEERKNYSNFKKMIVKNGTNERENYKQIKAKYVDELLERAKLK